MLKELHIKNIAVIDEINITFNNGFNVLTGETGAGKSILIDSINMALGGRISKDLVRTGENAAIVDAVFEINSDILPMLEDLDIDVEDETIIISRKLSSEGKSSCRINGRITPLAIVREVGSFLITI
ncbi:MAG: AAA family ATPase, partial [Oscillospiraceae bacterium]